MAHLRYLWYVLRHKAFVARAGRALGLPWEQLLTHDLSKFSREEWGPYARIFPFFGHFHDAPPAWVAAFERAWEHHWRHNPHHPEYWIARASAREPGYDAHTDPLMPEPFVREMVADWYGAGMAQGKPDIAGWYRANTTRQASLDASTKALVEDCLAELQRQGLIP